jgi:single-stranded-DNA-specific exonuclease
VSHLLHRYGGHAAAAGFTVRTDRLDELREMLVEVARDEYSEEAWTPQVSIDAPLAFPAVTFDLYEELRKLEPFGEGNPQPVFCAGNVQVRSVRSVGRDGVHLKLSLEQRGIQMEAIAFRKGSLEPHVPSAVDVAFNLIVNEWNGRRSLELRVVDLQPAGVGCPGAR